MSSAARRLVDLMLEHGESDMADPEEAREVEIAKDIKSLCGLSADYETLKEIEALADELLDMHRKSGDRPDPYPEPRDYPDAEGVQTMRDFASLRPRWRPRLAEAYTHTNYRTKKELKDAVARGERVTVYQPSSDLTGAETPQNGTISVEGPHYPEPHRWYASVTLKDGVVVAVR